MIHSLRKPLIFTLLTASLLTGCADTAMTSASFAYDRKSISNDASDRSIAFTAKSNIYSHPSVYDHSHIEVTVYHSLILLTGQVPTPEIRERAAYLASIARGARKVYNFLTVEKETSVWRQTKDTFISTKVRTQLLAAKDVDPAVIKVTTENGVVYLMGQVTEKEGQAATQIARTTHGVKKVVQVFEYVEVRFVPNKKA